MIPSKTCRIIIVLLIVASYPGVFPVLAGDQDQAAAHQNETDSIPINGTMTKEGKGPDYLVVSVDLPVSESITSPGSVIHPVITVKNIGDREPGVNQLSVGGYLNDTPLIPTSSISPLYEGEEKQYTLSFDLPESLSYGGYHLYLIVDPEGKTRDINTTNNRGKAGGMLSVSSPDKEEFFGCEECWRGYRD